MRTEPSLLRMIIEMILFLAALVFIVYAIHRAYEEGAIDDTTYYLLMAS